MKRHRKRNFASLLIVAAMLNGCGGGGGGGGDATDVVFAPPRPTSPTPPPPTGTAVTIGLTQMASFPTLGWVYRYATSSDGSLVPGSVAPPTSDRVEFGFDAGTQRHEILIPGLARSTLDIVEFRRDYTVSRLRPADRIFLRLYRPIAQNETIALAHTSFGHWTTNGVGEQNTGLFAYGVPTPAQSMPTGVTRYRAIALALTDVGDAPPDPLLLAAEGTLELSNDGATIGLSGQIGTMRSPMDSSFELPFLLADSDRTSAYGLTLQTYVPGGTFRGVLSTPDATGPSMFEGFLTGPGATELLLRFQAPYRDLETGRTGTLSGILVARMMN